MNEPQDPWAIVAELVGKSGADEVLGALEEAGYMIELASLLQQAWDKAAIDFIEAIQRACVCPTEVNDSPWVTDRGPHTASDVFGNLDRCTADDDSGANFTYGKLFGIIHCAESLGVTLKLSFLVP